MNKQTMHSLECTEAPWTPQERLQGASTTNKVPPPVTLVNGRNNENDPTGVQDRLWEAFKHRTYQVLGHRLDRKNDPRLANRLQQALLGWSPGLYKALQTTASSTVLLVSFGVFALIFAVLSPRTIWFPLAFGLSVLVALATMAAFPFTLRTKISNRGARLDHELPFSLSELAVLASIGLSPIEMIRKMSKRDYDQAMTSEFRRVVHKTDIQGRDLITALAETARESASDGVRQTFWDITNMIHQGGDLDEYLRNQSDAALANKRASQRRFIDQLGTFADIYVTIVLIGVMFLGVGAFLMDAFGTTAGGLGASALLKMLTYGIVPVLVTCIAILLATAHQKESG